MVNAIGVEHAVGRSLRPREPATAAAPACATPPTSDDRIEHRGASAADLASLRQRAHEHEHAHAHAHGGGTSRPTGSQAPAPPVVRHRFAGVGTVLLTSQQAERAIARGAHQIDIVDGTTLAFPSQDLRDIESADPRGPGQTHVLQRHVGSDLATNVARLRAEPHIRAAGGFTDLPSAQYATNETIANPANQHFLADFLIDASRSKDVLYRVDLGRVIGASTLRRDLDAGHPTLLPARSADVVVVKDASFPEGYRVLTSYPDATRGAEVDVRGNHV